MLSNIFHKVVKVIRSEQLIKVILFVLEKIHFFFVWFVEKVDFFYPDSIFHEELKNFRMSSKCLMLDSELRRKYLIESVTYFSRLLNQFPEQLMAFIWPNLIKKVLPIDTLAVVVNRWLIRRKDGLLLFLYTGLKVDEAVHGLVRSDPDCRIL